MSNPRDPTPSLQQYIDGLFADLQATVLMQEELTRQQLSSLSVLFGTTAQRALELVENGKVHCYTSSESVNRVYTVTSRGDKTKEEKVYVVFPYHFCKCDSFGYHVMTRKSQVYCKHILAVWLANALEQCKMVEVDDKELQHILEQHGQP